MFKPYRIYLLCLTLLISVCAGAQAQALVFSSDDFHISDADYTGQFSFTKESVLQAKEGSLSFIAPIDLPSGSVITRVIVRCVDSSATRNISAALYRVDYNGIADFSNANRQVETTGSSSAKQTIRILTGYTVNNSRYFYRISLGLDGLDYPSGLHTVYWVKVLYLLPAE